MTSSCLSVISFYKGYLRRAFTSAGLSSQTINIDSETTIHFWGPTRGLAVTAIKPSLLLIHGFGPLSYWYWQQQVPILAPQFNLYIPDLIFFGESTTTSSDRSEVFQAVSIGKLLDKIGVKRFSVMGASYGGFVAYHMAKMWPERVEKVVLLSSAINKKKKDEDDLLAIAKVEKIEDLMVPVTNKNMRTLIGLVMAKRYRILPNFVVADLINVMSVENRQEKLELYKGITLGQDDILHVSPLQQEVLIVWGKQDQLFRFEKAFELKKILGEKVGLVVLKNAAHYPHVEEPNQFNEIIKRFFCI